MIKFLLGMFVGSIFTIATIIIFIVARDKNDRG